MSWFSELSGKAENILNNLDKNAAKALNKRPNSKLLTYNEAILDSTENSSSTLNSELSSTTYVPSLQNESHSFHSTSPDNVAESEVPTNDLHYQVKTIPATKKNIVNPDFLRNEMLQNEIHSLNNEISLLLNRVKIAEQKSAELCEQLATAERKNNKLEEHLSQVLTERCSADDISSICKSLENSENKMFSEPLNKRDNNTVTPHEHYDKEIQELLQDKSNLEDIVRRKEDEIIMLKSRLSQKTYCFSADELQSRLRALTITLVQKQSSLESLTAEKNALVTKMNHLQKRYDEALGILHQSRINMNDTDDVKAQIPVFKSGRGFTHQLKRVYWNVFGAEFKKSSLLRLFIFFYFIVMHVLIFLLLHTHMPDSTNV